jgi:sec-independent protein translocase protein TatA
MQTLLAWGFPMGAEWIVIGIIGLMLFGKRLPEVGKSLGKGIVEFKKGLKGIEDEIDEGVNRAPSEPQRAALPAEFKFDPNTGEPLNREPQPTIARETAKPGHKFDPYTGQPISNS